jgi:hypothetical protein
MFGATLEDVSVACIMLVTHTWCAALAAATGHVADMHAALL